MGPTVVIVDDQPDFRRVARALLEADRFTVIGESGNAAGALEAVRSLHPDVVLLDVRLPDGDGRDVARALRALPLPPRIVLTSTADYARMARECGAAGFIPKAHLTGAAVRAVVESA